MIFYVHNSAKGLLSFLLCACMHSRGRVFALSVSLFVCLFVCLFVSLSTTFGPVCAFGSSSRTHKKNELVTSCPQKFQALNNTICALRRKLFIFTLSFVHSCMFFGVPGTGKTATVHNITACLQCAVREGEDHSTLWGSRSNSGVGQTMSKIPYNKYIFRISSPFAFERCS